MRDINLETANSYDYAHSSGRNSYRAVIEEVNPFRDGEGIRAFRELYTGKRRKDRNAWSDYFLSEAFLAGYREKAFAELMLEVVLENQKEYPPEKEFLTELFIVYGLKSHNDGKKTQLLIDNDAIFEGMQAIGEIALSGPMINRFKGNDLAMIEGFRDYRELLRLAGGSFDDEAILQLGKIVDRYLPHHISDKPIQDAGRYELSQRHPKSLRLLVYFFASQNLPERVCRVPWNHLHLESATMGRDKLWYGKLREVIMAKMSRTEERSKVNYVQFLQEIEATYWGAVQGRTEEERARMDELFEREDMLQALEDEVFAENRVLHLWVSKHSGKYFLEKLEEYYSSHRDAPFAEKILRKLKSAKQEQKIQEAFEEDEKTALEKHVFDLRKRPYLRYYLNVAFRFAAGIIIDPISLEEYLDQHMPYSPAWGKRLVAPGEGGFDREHPLAYRLGENVLRIFFHSQYIEYLWGEQGDSPLVPFFSWREFAVGMEDDQMFWLLAPVMAAEDWERPAVCEELVRRLSRLPLEQTDIPVIADCIAGRICYRFGDNAPVCTLFAEKEKQGEERLFGCYIYADGELELYEAAGNRHRTLPNGVYIVSTTEMAVSMGQKLLQELTADQDQVLELYIQLLPDRVMIRNKWNTPSTLPEGQITTEALKELFEKYFRGEVNRLELAWSGHSLLFFKEQQWYACLCFDDQAQCWYALVGMPEEYRRAEDGKSRRIPFGKGELPEYLLHHNPYYIRNHLNKILCQMACQKLMLETGMWSPQVYRTETRQRYHLAKCQIGGYPEEQTRNSLTDRFYIPCLPEQVLYRNMQGSGEYLKTAPRDKAALQAVLSDYMMGRLERLILVWQYGAADREDSSARRCLLLVQEQGSHVMLFMDSRIGKRMEYLVSNVREYMDAEGKKYRKVSFMGRTMPGYLVHNDLRRIRDCLDLLIPQMGQQSINKGGFGEFAYAGTEEFERVREGLAKLLENFFYNH